MRNSFIKRFIFDKLPVRGVYVVLNDVWGTISAQKVYPSGVKRVIGELLATNVLLTASLKLKGKLILQIQDNPNIDLAVSECSDNFNVRATAKFGEAIHNDLQLTYEECLSEGRLVMSIDNLGGSEFYQSIVSLSGQSVANALDEYMLQSEQLKTKFILAYSKDKVVGLMLQQLPDMDNEYYDEIERVFGLVATLTESELLNTELKILLSRLFVEDDVVVYEPHSIKFACSCGREKVANMLRSLGRNEAEAIIAEMEKIEVTCDFCNSVYVFNSFDVHNIFCSLGDDVDNISFEVH